MSIKRIISESIARNPIGIKEALEEAIKDRITAAINEKREKMESDDCDDGCECDDCQDDDEDDLDEAFINESSERQLSIVTRVFEDLDKQFTKFDNKKIADVNKVAKYLQTKNIPQKVAMAISVEYGDYRGGGKEKSTAINDTIKAMTPFLKKESVELDEAANTSSEEAFQIIANSISMTPAAVKDAFKAAQLDPVAVVTALKGKKTIKAAQLGAFVMGHAFGGSIRDLAAIKKASEGAFKATVKESVELDEAKAPKAAFGSTSDGYNFAVNVNGVDNNFLNKSFGQQIDDSRKIQEWKKTAKKGHAGAKGKATLAAVKAWVKMQEPTEFYAKWKSDSSTYKDDSVEIFYK